MEIIKSVDFTEILPTEVLFQICFNLTRDELAKCAFICKKFKPACMYVLEHKRKIRLVDDLLNVVFVSLPESGKTTLVETLAGSRFRKPYVGAQRTFYIKLDTKSMRGNNQVIGLIDAPNGRNYRKMNWICASQSDLCVFVVNALSPESVASFDKAQIQELILGVTHMMSSRDVIIAVNIRDTNYNSSTPENRFRHTERLITPILNKSIGPCFDIVPVDALKNIGVFPTAPFPWFKGPSLWTLLIDSQKNSNYNAKAVEQLRQAPFEFQTVNKMFIRGVSSGLAIGRVLSGSISVNKDPTRPNQVRLIPHRESYVRSIQLGGNRINTAVAGDYVGFDLKGLSTTELRKRYGFIWTYIDPVTNEQVPIDITLAFRMQFVVVDPKLLALRNVYYVHYGAHRIHCVLLWIFPSETYKSPADVKKLKRGEAIMVPLERVPMRVYKANAFQKNVHGKVMLTQKYGTIAAIGRIDKVLSKKMDLVTMPNAQDYIQLYETVMNEAQALFGSSLEEEKLLAEFVAYMKDNIQARHSIAGCTKRFSDRRYYERNE